MVAARYRAWRFQHPDFDLSAPSVGLCTSTTGGIDMIDEHASVRQGILLLLSTAPGERVMRPDYGCDLNQLVFMPNEATTHGLAIHYVQRALDRWEPRIEILRLDATRSEADPSCMDIVLEYRVRGAPSGERLSVPFKLS